MPLLEVDDLNEQSTPRDHAAVSKSVEHPVGQEVGENKAQCADIGGYMGKVESKDEDEDGEEDLDLNERSMSPDCVAVAKSAEYPLGQGANENKAEHADVGGHGDQVDNKDEDGHGEELNEQGTSPDHVEVAKSTEHHMGQEVNENKAEHVDVGCQGDRVDNKDEDGDGEGEEHLDLNEQSMSPDHAPVVKSIKHPMGQEANENKAERPDVGGHGDQVDNKDEVEDEEEDLDLNEQITIPDYTAIAQGIEHPMGQVANVNKAEHADVGGHGDHVDDKDDDEDVDFNPFLKETPSQEASSSLSSEIERLDADVVDSGGYASAALLAESMAKDKTPVQDFPVGETDHDEEIVTQMANSSVEECMKDSQSGPSYENGDGSGYQMNVDYSLVAGEPSNLAHFKKPLMDMDDGDAICMRTRARYSLASFTLDELETFLQETDDEDNLQNVLDDEAEYRKFLAAVLQGGDGDIQGTQDNENADDEDEENDADFELEIEEALESDNDEDARYEIQEHIYETAGRHPKTRQNRHQKASVGGNKKLLGQRPLRPLLPCVPIVQSPVLPIVDGTNVMRNHSVDFLPSISDGSTNGFTFHQIGQLHCLIHEHVQLLIQVFSICVLEPARRHIATKVQELILEMLRVRENALAWRRLPYPSFCFFPPYIHPSVPNEIPTSSPEPCVNEAASVVDVRRNCLSGNKMVSTDMISFGKGRCESQHNGQTLEGHYWMPYISDPVLSVMDVAPLKLVANFLDDVSVVVQEYHRRLIGLTCDTSSEKEPLFPLSTSKAASVPGDILSRDTDFPTSVTVHVSPNNNQLPKRTMASALVEKAKKRSVVLVPKEIAQLAWRFYPLFNAALYPHKPPLASVANRVLFTDAEDELLALGFMEYNTDWKAIEQRYLPCKSKHQIFVRQKNRSSSKAPENPIKAVRRMKHSPLTSEEIARIEEGMKIYRLDWMSIWKFAAPHRDPSLLHRQWRIATGTQKSYKVDADKLAKRRLYDLRRRNQKSAALANCHSSPDKEDNRADKDCEENSNGHNQMDREDEAYLHEAFLADWRPGTSKVSSAFPDLVLQSTPVQTLLREGSQFREQLPSSGSGDGQPSIPNELPATLRSPNPPLRCRPYRARKANNARVVKLAPDLPPVNLPPSVRVMSQSAFKSYQTGATFRTCTSDASHVGPEAGNGVLDVAKCNANSRDVYLVKAGQVTRIPVNSSSGNKQPEDSIAMRTNKFVAERNDESDLQMHPLLFQAPDDGHFLYYPLRSSASTSSSFNFFAGSPPQLNLTLFHNPKNAAASTAVNFLGKSLKPKKSTKCCQTDFHPLLQGSEGMDSSLVAAHSATQLSTNLEISEGRCDRIQNTSLTTDKISCLNISSTSASLRPVSPSEKSNELDLDIHLSFTSRQPVAVGSRDVSECAGAISVTNAADLCSFKSQKAKDPVIQSSQNMAVVPDKSGSEFDSTIHTVVVPSDEGNRESADDIDDHSLPEIVMEKEELSDSDDEIGENVKFECEEMADSEAEDGSDSEPVFDIQNEEVEEAGMDANFADQPHKPRRFDDSESNALETIQRGMLDRKVDKSLSNLRLNLNSQPPTSPLVEPENEGLRGGNSSLDSKVHSCSGKANENILCMNDDNKVAKQVVNVVPQRNLDSGISSSKKPLKRSSVTCRSLSGDASRRKKHKTEH